MTASRFTLKELWGRLAYLRARFKADRCMDNAAALTYMSLFALVPLLTVTYTMASAIPDFQGLEEKMLSLVFEHMLPSSSAEIEKYLSDFSSQARNLTGAGIAFLVVTAVLMLRNIERAFNLIWRARKNRSAVSSFVLYWAVLTLAPVTIGLALGLGTYLTSVASLLDRFDTFGTRHLLLQFAPLLLSTAGFALVYTAVPNCRVPIRHALAGGLFAALAIGAARTVFTKLVVGSSITFIYGAFAAVPLFLLWIYLSWNIVLFGGIFVHSLSAYQNSSQARRPIVIKALQVLNVLWHAQQSGETVREIDMLNNRYRETRGLDSDTWHELRNLLMDKQVIAQAEKGHYLLSRDLNTLPFWQLKEWVLHEQVLGVDDPSEETWHAQAYQLLRDERRSERELLSTNLADLFQQ